MDYSGFIIGAARDAGEFEEDQLPPPAGCRNREKTKIASDQEVAVAKKLGLKYV